ALRSAVGACAVCGGLVLGRLAVPANLFALAWLVVAVVDPADLTNSGCQLSFLSVAVLCYATGWLARRDDDPLPPVIDPTPPARPRPAPPGSAPPPAPPGRASPAGWAAPRRGVAGSASSWGGRPAPPPRPPPARGPPRPGCGPRR